MDAFADLLSVEWENRKLLAEGVTTPEIDAMMAAAESQGARASKVCGAGGGGCMITFADPDALPAVRRALVGAGAALLPDPAGRAGGFRIVPDGLQMSVAD
jgi:D-glycero-alpha-D-manno-heptose-7-phosphate kinase